MITRRQRDRILDLYFKGRKIRRIAKIIGIELTDAQLCLKLHRTNPGVVEEYKPVRRTARKGLPVTENEWKFFHSHKKRGIPLEETAALLCRSFRDFLTPIGTTKIDGQLKFNFMKSAAPTLDQLLAHKYLYYHANCPVISDKEYDSAKAEEIEFGCGRETLAEAKHWRQVCDIPPHIRSLAYYIQYKFLEAQGLREKGRTLPYDHMLHLQKKKK